MHKNVLFSFALQVYLKSLFINLCMQLKNSRDLIWPDQWLPGTVELSGPLRKSSGTVTVR